MELFKQLFNKKIKENTATKEYTNDIKELIENDFNVMFITKFNIFNDEEMFKLKYQYCEDYRYTCINCHYNYESFNTKYYLECMKKNKCVIIEMKGLGSFIFTSCHRDSLFLVLQRYFKDVISCVFKGNDTGGYFKILKNGRIVRKIASWLITEGITNNPETRGKPCEYEIEKGKTWKVDMKATKLKDMLPDFMMKDVLDLFDYYVSLDNFKNENIERIVIYSLVM